MKLMLAILVLLLAPLSVLHSADLPSLLPPKHVAPPAKEHAATNRAFQGIPSLAVAPKGRLWATWYAGVTPAEDLNNYVVLSTSGDDGKTWKETLIVDPDAGGPVRTFDPELWVAPDGRLFFFWAQMEKGRADTRLGVWCIETMEPDAEQPKWSKPRRIADGVMMCKPMALSTGEWVLPISKWKAHDNSAQMIVSADQGKTWTLRGGCNVPVKDRQYDEHHVVERKDKSLWMLVRTNYGIGESISTDGGKTWPELKPSAIPHTTSRFFIRRLASGNLLLVKHGPLDEKGKRSHLTAYRSKDDGKTWTGGLLLDERLGVSYPDGQQTPDGLIRIIYDFSRTGDREILMASFREEDVAAGKDASGSVKLRQVMSKASGGQEKKPAPKAKASPTAAGPVKVETVMVPMRDGVRLATDIYRDPALRKAPVVLMRTPYNKDRGKAAADRFATAGYIAVVQDCRGKFASEGTFIPYNNEGQDGFDSIEWLTRQPWCDGRVGMWGGSYVGAAQWQAAVEQPPGLVTITPTATWSNFYRNLYLGGAVRHSLITKWAASNSPKPEGAQPPKDWDRVLLHLPLSEADDQIGWPVPWLESMLTHPTPDGYWKRLDLTPDLPNLKLPMQHVVGYYDFFSRESVSNFVRMQKSAKDATTRRQQQLILGPWDHGSIGKSKVGDLDFGPNAVWDATSATLEWFDRTLKRDPSVTAAPLTPVRYFVMGENAWHTAETWPPPGTKETAFHLRSGGKANTRSGDGRLDLAAPTTDEPVDSFLADPADPTPAAPVTATRPLYAATWAPVDQRPIEDRKDVLVYTTEPLKTPLTFAGDARAELYVSADTLDADWVVKLVDVHPDGAAYNLAVGIQRARFRESEHAPKPLVPGENVKLTIDLGPIAAQIASGHRLRVDVSGAYFPLFDRNPNTGEGPFSKATAIATESLHHTPARPSRIVLPVIEHK